MLRSVATNNSVWAGSLRVASVQAGLETLARLLQDTPLSVREGEGISSLCELMADELGRAHDEIDRATRQND